MRADDRTRVQHLIDAGEIAIPFLAGRSRDDLERDQMRRFAVVGHRDPGRGGEPRSTETRAALPHVSWGAMVGTRNRLMHGSFGMDTVVVWKTVREEIPPLVRRLKAALGEG